MALEGIEQPAVIPVGEDLRLCKFEHIPEAAFGWYQDIETVYLVDGVRVPYTREKLERMYRYLNNHMELYIIEALEDGAFRPIGDVSFSKEDMPIVIGDRAYRGRGVGSRVIEALIRRGRTLRFDSLGVSEIYHYNTASRRCFEKAGFRVCAETKDGQRLTLEL